jgi:hypothetical protein
MYAVCYMHVYVHIVYFNAHQKDPRLGGEKAGCKYNLGLNKWS